jgi:hypothetical protein
MIFDSKSARGMRARTDSLQIVAAARVALLPRGSRPAMKCSPFARTAACSYSVVHKDCQMAFSHLVLRLCLRSMTSPWLPVLGSKPQGVSRAVSRKKKSIVQQRLKATSAARRGIRVFPASAAEKAAAV